MQLPDECIGCQRIDEEGCIPYKGKDISWVTRRGGCFFNAPFAECTKQKVNPLKASKRGKK